MESLGQFIADRRRAGLVVALVVLFAVVCGALGARVEQQDDLLAFLPQDNPEVTGFRAVNERFGGLDVALIGIETTDVFDPAFLDRLRQATRALRELPDVDHVLSLSNVEDFAPDPQGGIRTASLVEDLPRTAVERAELRTRVLEREQVVGNLVDARGQAVVIYAFITSGADLRLAAVHVREAVAPLFEEDTLYWGGNPMVSTAIFDAVQADMDRLTPWAILTILAIMVLSFRSIVGTAAGLFATGVGILATRAAMAVLGIPLNVVLGSMPILMFAIGSAYGIHLLARYQVHARTLSPEDAAAKTLTHTGPVVLTAGLTTVAGLFSFVLMDIEPLRIFGAFTALGIGVALLVSLVFVPAVAVLVRLPGRFGAGAAPPRWPVRLVMTLQRQRPTAAIVLFLLALAGAGFTLRVDTRTDHTAFYAEDSAPAAADAFLREHFGGSTFVQIAVRAPLGDPHVLRELQRLADELGALEHVSRVQHVGEIVALLNDAMEGGLRIPDTDGKVRGLFGLLRGKPSVRPLLTDDRTESLLVVRLDTRDLDEINQTLEDIEEAVGRAPRQPSAPTCPRRRPAASSSPSSACQPSLPQRARRSSRRS